MSIFRHGYETLWSNFTAQFCFLCLTIHSSSLEGGYASIDVATKL